MSIYSNTTTDNARDKIAEKTNPAFSDAKDKVNEIKGDLKSAASCVEGAANKAGKNMSDLANSVSDRVCSASDLSLPKSARTRSNRRL